MGSRLRPDSVRFPTRQADSEPPGVAADGNRSEDGDTVVLQPGRDWRLGVTELFSHRELLYFLIWRDVKVRYKQTALGAAWAVFQPLVLMAVLAVFLGYLARVPAPEQIPYWLFVFTALVPWTLFASSLNWAVPSLVKNSHLLSRVYFPRLLLPVAAAGSFVLDFLIALGLLIAAMLLFSDVTLSPRMLALPAFTLLAVGTAMGVGILLSAVNAKYRDVQHGIPLLVQVWMFLSPVVYSSDLVPARWRTLYGLNPLASVVEGFRYSLLGLPLPGAGLLIASTGVMVILLLVGLLYFHRVERSFADVI